MTYSVSDANGNAPADVVRTVSVVDTTKPVITLVGNATETVEAKGTYTDAGASASDTTGREFDRFSDERKHSEHRCSRQLHGDLQRQ